MKIVKPTTLTTAMVLSSTVPEEVVAGYNGATTYPLGAQAGVNAGTSQVVYESLQAGNIGHTPSASPTWWRKLGTVYAVYSAGTAYALNDKVTDLANHDLYQSLIAANTGNALSDKAKWQYLGKTNRWAKYDNKVGTATVGPSPMTDVLAPGSTTGAAFFEMVGRVLHVVMKDVIGGTVVYDRTIDLDGTVVEDVFDWFFADYEQRSDLVLTDLPGQFPNCELSHTVTATSGDVASGVCKPGKLIDIGTTTEGARVGIMDFSGKDRDEFGNLYILEREYSKRGSFEVLTEKARFNKIFRVLASLRATPCIYVGIDAEGFEPLLQYGWFRDFSILIPYPSHHICSLEIEGLI
jgi:hypothetical protein